MNTPKITNTYLDDRKTSVIISHETVRKDFVAWCGFSLIGVFKSLDEAKQDTIKYIKNQAPGEVTFSDG